MLLPKLGGFWLLPPRDFSQPNQSHPMDHDSNSSGHTNVMPDPDYSTGPISQYAAAAEAGRYATGSHPFPVRPEK